MKPINMTHIVMRLIKDHNWEQWPLPYAKEHQRPIQKEYEKSHENIFKVFQPKRHD